MLRLLLAALLAVSLAATTDCCVTVVLNVYAAHDVAKRGNHTYNRWVNCSMHVLLPQLVWYTLVFVRVPHIILTPAAGFVCCFYRKSMVCRPRARICCCCRSVCCHWVVFLLPVHLRCWCCPFLHWCRWCSLCYCCSCTAAQLLLMFMLHVAKRDVQCVNLLSARTLLYKGQEKS